MATDEQTPLLPKSVQDDTSEPVPKTGFGSFTERLQKFRPQIPAGMKNKTFEYDQEGKLVFYDHQCLLTTRAFFQVGCSVFVDRPVWSCLIYVTVVAGISAAAMLCIPNAKSFDTERFRTFCTFLKVFISFMLAIYVQHSFARWWNTVSCFEDFLIDIKQMMFFMHSLRVDPQMLDFVQTYAIGSSYVLSAELQAIDQGPCVDGRVPKMLERLRLQGIIDEEEQQVLLNKHKDGAQLQVCRTVWSWIAEILVETTKLDGTALLPPMFIRLTTLCQGCIGKIEHIKRNVAVQTPFAYAHLLAMLVHTNNTILAVFGGLTLGSALAEMMSRGADVQDASNPSGHMMRNFYGAIQTTAGQLIIMVIEPMLYVGFLHIAHMLCYPFGDQRFNLPAETYIHRLHNELEAMAENRQYYRNRLAQEDLLGFVKVATPRSPKKGEGKKDEDDEEADDAGGGGDGGGDCGDV